MSRWSFRWLLDQWWLEPTIEPLGYDPGFRWLLDQWWLEQWFMG